MIGTGPMKEKLERRALPGVTFLGRLNAAREVRAHRACARLIATSVREGWGLTITEAAVMGTQAVAYDIPDCGLRTGGRRFVTEAKPEGSCGVVIAELPRLMDSRNGHRPPQGAVTESSWRRKQLAFLEPAVIQGVARRTVALRMRMIEDGSGGDPSPDGPAALAQQAMLIVSHECLGWISPSSGALHEGQGALSRCPALAPR